jgi:hypothetical protein
MHNIGFDWLLRTIGSCGGIQLILILNKAKLHVWDFMFMWDGQITCTLFWGPAFTLWGQGFKTEIGTASRWETSNSNPLGPIKLSSQSETGAVNK